MASKRSKNKVYLVETSEGQYRTFTDWASCEKYVHGRHVSFAGGANEPEALAKLLRSKTKNVSREKKVRSPAPDLPTIGICSDAGTKGNPGPCEYQITDLDGHQLEHKFLGVHSNNYAELAGIGAMVQYAIRSAHELLWTDSKIAMGWISTGRVGETVHEREVIIKMAKKIQQLLDEHPSIQLKKWHTRRWGEIPADFGRK